MAFLNPRAIVASHHILPSRLNDRFYSGLLRESPVRRAHDIPCWTSHANIAWPSPPSKTTSSFQGRAGLSPRRFLPAHRGTPLMYIPRMLPHSHYFLLQYTECHGPACSPHGAVALPQRGLHRQCSDRRCPVWAKISHSSSFVPV